jgi:hypothetical protein
MRHNPGWSGLIATAALAALLWAGASGSATGDPTDDADQAGEAAPARAVLHERVDGHRPLRGNPPAAEPPPAEPQTFDGYPDAPAFSVVPRKDHLQFFPDFNDAYLVCGQCHYQPQKDWYYGGHGKRAEARWQGERTIYNCTHCHNPHAAAIHDAPTQSATAGARRSRSHAETSARAPPDMGKTDRSVVGE